MSAEQYHHLLIMRVLDMAISLHKGQRISLTKIDDPALQKCVLE